jgi:hypothetical protein
MPFKSAEEKKAYHREYHKKWYANPDNAVRHKACAKKHRDEKRVRNREFIDAYKSKCKCERCPEDHLSCLDFHHIDPTTKLYNVSEMSRTNLSLETIEAEIAKCMILCRNCHAKLHWKEKQ